MTVDVKLNVCDDGPQEKPGKSLQFFNNGPHEKIDEFTLLLDHICNGTENYENIKIW